MTLWVRFRHEGIEGFGTLADGAITPHAGDMFAAAVPAGPPVALANATLLAPLQPGCFMGLWNNFHEAAAKQSLAIPAEPLWFHKTPRCVIGPDAPITPPPSYTGRVVYEGELGIVIGRPCHAASDDEAEAAIFGFTAVNDVTATDLLTADPSFAQWARAKGCDSFGPIGPAIATGLDWRSLRIQVALNGRVRQDYPASDMIIPPARIVSLISREMTLLPGDLIACGTSIGVLPMRAGMEVTVTIEGIGSLRNVFAPQA